MSFSTSSRHQSKTKKATPDAIPDALPTDADANAEAEAEATVTGNATTDETTAGHATADETPAADGASEHPDTDAADGGVTSAEDDAADDAAEGGTGPDEAAATDEHAAADTAANEAVPDDAPADTPAAGDAIAEQTDTDDDAADAAAETGTDEAAATDDAVTDGPAAADTGTGTGSGAGTDEAAATDSAVTDEPVAADTAAGDTGPEEVAAASTARSGWRRRHPVAARNVAWGVSGLALALVLFALLMPNQPSLMRPARFVRIPAEGVLIAALLLVVPPRARKIVVVVCGLLIGLMTINNSLDIGFYSVLSRPFNPVLDWILFGDGISFLKDAVGEGWAMATVVGVIALVIVIPVLMVLALIRVSNLMTRHRTGATRTTVLLGTAWLACSTLGVQFLGVPVASRSATQHVQDGIDRVNNTLKDEQVFAKQAAIDKFKNTPSSQLLSGLRGKDVIFTFIESYGRSAVEDPSMAPGVDAVLQKQTKSLKEAGWATRSGWLTSPVTGAGSWLAHTTLLSGLWVQNQQRYRNVTASNRMTITSAFKKTGAWSTVGMMPGVTRAWPEGKFFGLNTVYDSRDMGYQGPKFGWSPVPDEYTLKSFDRLAYGKTDRGPMMAEIVLATSHNPWSPLPTTIPWDQVGDGSVYKAQHAAGTDPTQVWKTQAGVRNAYATAIKYSVTNLTNFMTKYANKNTVLVFLGDHQPVTTVTGSITASRDVPIAMVAKDPKVFDKISDWGWTDSLQPAHNAPVWRMDSFRNRFLTAFSG